MLIGPGNPEAVSQAQELALALVAAGASHNVLGGAPPQQLAEEIAEPVLTQLTNSRAG